jgi:predicted acetyltransferase
MSNKEVADKIKKDMQELLDLTVEEQQTQTINSRADELWNRIINNLQILGDKDE